MKVLLHQPHVTALKGDLIGSNSTPRLTSRGRSILLVGCRHPGVHDVQLSSRRTVMERLSAYILRHCMKQEGTVPLKAV